TEADEPAGTDVLDAVGIAKLIVARPDGSVIRG
ncbi:MAG: hypothetical protein QOJ32_2446, partial [Frankiaceae bacterium]|nr:hypothetical protein [Frankiaceae bacterium]